MTRHEKHRQLLKMMHIYGGLALADPPVRRNEGWYLRLENGTYYGPYCTRREARNDRWSAQKWCREMVCGEMA